MVPKRNEPNPDIQAAIDGLRSRQYDASRLIAKQKTRLDILLEGVQARSVLGTPLTVEERFQAFERIGFKPYGLYIPTDPARAAKINSQLAKISVIRKKDEREREYWQLQEECKRLYARKIPGRWNGQMEMAYSTARFIIAAKGRRSGKSKFAYALAQAQALMRPRSTIWATAPTNDAVSRIFDMIVENLLDLGLKDSCNIWRNTKDDRLIELPNGSRYYGISLDSPISGAGTAVDLAIVDEAAYVVSTAWGRQILPTLADRNGCALIISSPETDDDWFWKQLKRAQRESEAGVWAGFRGPSWDNFYMFPQGRKSLTLKQIEAEYTDPREFLRRYGALPSGAAERIYPEYRERVHVDSRVAFDESRPVFLAVDPSAGAAPYAVLALQDYGDMVHVIDEYYERGVTTELVCKRLGERPWFANIGMAIVDPAYEIEITRWQMMGVPAVPVTIETKDHKEAIAKPTIEDTIPLVQRLLREPLRFYQLTQGLRHKILAELGADPENPTPEQELELVYMMEERLSDPEMSEEDVLRMRECARLAIAPHCINLQEEFTLYKRREIHKGRPDLKETPIDDHNHLLDSLRYYCWMMKRSLLTDMGSTSYLVQQAPASYYGNMPGAKNWLQEVRQRIDAAYTGGVTYLQEA